MAYRYTFFQIEETSAPSTRKDRSRYNGSLLPSQLYNVKKSTKDPETIFDRENTQTGIVEPGSWSAEGMPDNNTLPLGNVGSNNYSNKAKRIREEFKELFVTPQGEVPWQYSSLS
jgi:hypothetical protein